MREDVVGRGKARGPTMTTSLIPNALQHTSYFHPHCTRPCLHTTRHNIANLKPLTAFLIFLTSLITLPTMGSIFQRLTRPFTSSTLRFAPEGNASAMNVPEGAQKATLAAGCFWGIEHMYRKDFGKKGLIDARVGYIGGDTQNPTYRAVCSGRTGRKGFREQEAIGVVLMRPLV